MLTSTSRKKIVALKPPVYNCEIIRTLRKPIMKVKKSILSLVVSFALIALSTQFAIAQCGCTHIVPLNSPYVLDGKTLKSLTGSVGVKPGDKVCFASGSRGAILLQNFKGT